MDIGLQKKDRRLVADALNRVLADTVILSIKTLNYHWNVVGRLFIPLHSLFQDQYSALIEAADDIAERIRALGFPAAGSFAEYTKLTVLTEESEQPEAMEMVRKLLLDHEHLIRRHIDVQKAAESVGDDGTVDLMVERIRKLSKAAWILRSHLDA